MTDMEELEPLGENEVYYDHELVICPATHDLTDAEIASLMRKAWADPRTFEPPDKPVVNCRLADKHDGPHAQYVGGTWVTWDENGSRFDETTDFCPYKNYGNGDCELPENHPGPHALSFW